MNPSFFLTSSPDSVSNPNSRSTGRDGFRVNSQPRSDVCGLDIEIIIRVGRVAVLDKQ